ncbi:MAG TPA: hypothetical protein VFZ51_05475, partial [Woeseiaceae bacterium]
PEPKANNRYQPGFALTGASSNEAPIGHGGVAQAHRGGTCGRQPLTRSAITNPAGNRKAAISTPLSPKRARTLPRQLAEYRIVEDPRV